MWNITKNIKIEDKHKKETGLRLLELGNLNIKTAPFCKVSPSLTSTRSNSFSSSSSVETPTNSAQQVEIIKQDDVELIPLITQKITRIKAEISPLVESSLTRVYSPNSVTPNSYYWKDGFTYLCTDDSVKTYKGQISFIANSSVELTTGIFTDYIYKVTASGLPVSFTKDIENQKIVFLIPSKKSCRVYVGNKITLYFEIDLPTNNEMIDKQVFVYFFSKQNLNIDSVTFLTYKGQNFSIQPSFENLTSNQVFNSINNLFYILSDKVL